MQEGWILLMDDSVTAVGGGLFSWLVGAFFIVVHMIMTLVSVDWHANKCFLR
jgi:hypothetical protein